MEKKASTTLSRFALRANFFTLRMDLSMCVKWVTSCWYKTIRGISCSHPSHMQNATSQLGLPCRQSHAKNSFIERHQGFFAIDHVFIPPFEIYYENYIFTTITTRNKILHFFTSTFSCHATRFLIVFIHNKLFLRRLKKCTRNYSLLLRSSNSGYTRKFIVTNLKNSNVKKLIYLVMIHSIQLSLSSAHTT